MEEGNSGRPNGTRHPLITEREAAKRPGKRLYFTRPRDGSKISSVFKRCGKNSVAIFLKGVEIMANVVSESAAPRLRYLYNDRSNILVGVYTPDIDQQVVRSDIKETYDSYHSSRA